MRYARRAASFFPSFLPLHPPCPLGSIVNEGRRRAGLEVCIESSDLFLNRWLQQGSYLDRHARTFLHIPPTERTSERDELPRIACCLLDCTYSMCAISTPCRLVEVKSSSVGIPERDGSNSLSLVRSLPQCQSAFSPGQGRRIVLKQPTARDPTCVAPARLLQAADQLVIL